MLIRGGRIIDPGQGLDAIGDVLVQEGKVAQAQAGSMDGLPDSCAFLEAQGLIVCPGFIDLHSHLREPGYEDKETIATGTRAAARGGFTTICAMPNTNPAMDTRATVDYVKGKAQEEGVVRVLPIGCVTKGRQGKELAEMAELAEAGVIGFSDDGSPVSDPNIMRQAMVYSRGLGLPIINHCEELSLSHGGHMHEGWVATRLGVRGIPSAAEDVMSARDIELAQLTSGRLHLAHVSTRGAMEMVRRAKERGVGVTCEATPHHLTMTDQWLLGHQGEGGPFDSLSPQAYDTRCKVSPPLRSQEDREALIEALREGVVDIIATDHAPHALVDKVCPLEEAAAGISVLETALGSLMSLVKAGSIDIATLISRMTWGPAQLLGANLGTLRSGFPADITIFDPEAQWVVDVSRFASKGKNTPLEGATLAGKAMATIVEGKLVHREDGLNVMEWWRT